MPLSPAIFRVIPNTKYAMMKDEDNNAYIEKVLARRKALMRGPTRKDCRHLSRS